MLDMPQPITNVPPPVVAAWQGAARIVLAAALGALGLYILGSFLRALVWAAILALARKLTTDPALITDADIQALRARLDDKQVAEVVHQVTEAAFFDRLTEAARLRLED